MDLYEYQARDLFEKYGVPVLPGIVADTPEAVRAAAEQLAPDVPRLDLFSRASRPGWTAWGNEAGLFDTPEPPERRA